MLQHVTGSHVIAILWNRSIFDKNSCDINQQFVKLIIIINLLLLLLLLL